MNGLVAPVLLRRWVIAPVWLVVSAAIVLVSLPFVALAHLVLPIAPAPFRPLLRLFVTTIAYLAIYECGGLSGCFVLWLGSGFGRTLHSPPSRRRHLALHRRLVSATVRVVAVLSRTTIDVDVEACPVSVPADRPVLVLAQHSGAFNVVMVPFLVQISLYRTMTAVVTDALRLDPAIDVLFERCRGCFIRPGDLAGLAAIESWSRTSDSEHARVLLPEGTSFTARRRTALMDRLRSRGLVRRIEIAMSLERVLPPNFVSVHVALTAVPGSDVLFVAHNGLSPLPTGRSGGADRLRAKCWLVPAAAVPTEPAAQGQWIHHWWKQIDEWNRKAGP